MQQIILRVKDDKLNFFMELLKQLDFVEIQKGMENEAEKEGEGYNFFESAGLWKGRDIDAQQLREQSWERSH